MAMIVATMPLKDINQALAPWLKLPISCIEKEHLQALADEVTLERGPAACRQQLYGEFLP